MMRSILSGTLLALGALAMALLGAGAAGCATSAHQCPAPAWSPAVLAPVEVAPPAAAEPVSDPDPTCTLRPPPRPPAIDVQPRGCPTTFAGCLSGPDAHDLDEYLMAVRRWSSDAYRRCPHDR